MKRENSWVIWGGMVIMVHGAITGAAWAAQSADYADIPTTCFMVNREAFFPLGIYHFPKGIDPETKFAELGEGGFNMALLPIKVTKEELDDAHVNGIRVMITPRGLFRFSKGIDLEKRKADLLAQLGPGSIIYDHPAVFALEMPDEPLWMAKEPFRSETNKEVFAWGRPPAERQQIYESITELKDAYAWLRETCGDRYQVWLNFAPRGHEIEMSWYTALPPQGGYPPDPRTAADAFGTDVYPVPDGGGNNGWVNGNIIRSPAAAGLFTDRLRRAVSPHPFYMVLQGCGILEWQREQNPDSVQRRPALEESRFMAFQSIVHGARGILYWGVAYIEADSAFWGELKQVAEEVRAFAPVVLRGEPWPEALVGTSRLESLALTYQGDHYLVVVNPGDWPEVRVSVPGWRGAQANSLLDGKTATVENGVLLDQLPPFGVRIYTDAEGVLLGFPSPEHK